MSVSARNNHTCNSDQTAFTLLRLDANILMLDMQKYSNIGWILLVKMWQWTYATPQSTTVSTQLRCCPLNEIQVLRFTAVHVTWCRKVTPESNCRQIVIWVRKETTMSFYIIHCSLRLIVRSELEVPTFATRPLHACHRARAPSGGRWNCGRELSGNFA
jgi:hypothetical protein